MRGLIIALKSILQVIHILLTKPIVIKQLFDTRTIPIIIINFNQLFYLQQLIEFLLNRGFKKIVIIDNNSTYQPLLSYYDTISDKVSIDRRSDNLGHMVFFKDPLYMERYGKGFYIVTDPDIIPNEKLPKNFLLNMIKVLFKNYNRAVKVGFALDLESIPDYYPLKNKVLNWEKQFWEKQLSRDVYLAYIDTTFSLYRPGYDLDSGIFYTGIRMAGDYVCKHGGWYLNPNAFTDENLFYMNSVNDSASWIIDEGGNQKFNKNVI